MYKHELDQKLLGSFLKEYPHSVNYAQHSTDFGDFGKPFKCIVTAQSRRYRTHRTIGQHFKVTNLSYSCTVELTGRQNDILVKLINDQQILSEAKFNTSEDFKRKVFDVDMHNHYSCRAEDDVCIIL
jgi:hypothetical protein